MRPFNSHDVQHAVMKIQVLFHFGRIPEDTLQRKPFGWNPFIVAMSGKPGSTLIHYYFLILFTTLDVHEPTFLSEEEMTDGCPARDRFKPVKPDIFNETSEQFPAVFAATKSVKAKYDR